MSDSLTQGAHHIGLTVTDVEVSARFFIDQLGWREVKRRPDYPAIFVSDGQIMLTLWQAQSDSPRPFDRKANIGLHHLALQVASEGVLDDLCRRLQAAGCAIEFEPQPLGPGPAKHMMCYEPSGIRLEFIFAG